MKVILVKDVENLGEEGDVQDVADGYGRNYLLPKQLALPYNKANLAMLESRRTIIEQRKEDKRQAALSLKQRLEEEDLVMRRPAGGSGKLFGSVTSAAIAEELAKRGINVERKRIELPEHNLKMIGTYPVRVKLYDNEAAELKVKILSSEGGEEEAPAEAKPAEKAAEAPVPEAAAEEPAAEEPPAAEEAAAEEPAAEEPPAADEEPSEE